MNYKIAPTYFTRLLQVQANITPGKALLNAGCGTGEFNYYLKYFFDKSFGVDVNSTDIGIARALNSDPNIQFDVGDVTKLNFEDDFFDSIICVDVLEHVDDPMGALKEFYRVLKPDGQMILTVPHRNYPFFYDPLNFVRERLSGKHWSIGIWGFGHTKLFDQQTLMSLLENSRFSIIHKEGLTHGFCGLIEGYLPTLLQPLAKSNASNREKLDESEELKEKKFGFSYHIPPFLERILRLLIGVDRFLGKKSSFSVGLLIVAEKKEGGN